MAAQFLRRLSSTASPALNALRGSNNSRRISVGAAAAVASGVAIYYFYSSPPIIAQLDVQNEKAVEKTALGGKGWTEFKLQHSERVTHNTQLFRFSIDPDAKLGLQCASFVITRAPASAGLGRFAIRPYTPVSDPDAKGYFDLLIKVYPGGVMSQFFSKMKPGDVVEMRGPIQALKYTPNMKKKIGMVAGGAGITPMLQLLRTVLNNPDDHTELSLVYSNTTPEDIILKSELDKLASSHPNFKVFYTVSKPSEGWTGGVGHVTKEIIAKELPGPDKDTQIFVCGPPGFMDLVSGDKRFKVFQGSFSGLLKEAGYSKDMVFKF